ncbi:MAG: glycoside hydrolase family 88 protein [Planctomycetota bacterium]
MRPQTALLVVGLSVFWTAPSAESSANEIFTREKIVEVMRRVRDYQLAHPWKETDRNWIRATYYTGVMGLYRTTGDREILDQAVRWAEKHDWAEGDERERANKKTCGQTYLELYFIKPDPERIAKIRAYVDSRIERVRAGEPPTKGWYYCDTLYVGPPTLAMLAKATGDQEYNDYLNEVYWAVADLLFDEEHGLFYRDASYFDAATPSGRKVFWSRGNGWVLGGIPRVLEYLPKENEHYDRYVELFRTMSASIAKRQGADGLWRSNLDDPHQCPNPETSGTAFFCYAMCWGINNGLLDRQHYLRVVMRAWGGLARHVHLDGKLGFVQPVGGSPKPATSEMTHEYAMGLLLLAGEQMVKLVESEVISDEDRKKYEKECQEFTGRDRWTRESRWPDTVDVVDMPLSARFKRLKAPGTGRSAVQLTSGGAFCYPLYYFIPSITKDAKYLIYHRAESGEVQLFRLTLRNGESVQLTHGTCPKTQWRYWCVESGRGVLDHRSVLNVARGKVVYFDGNRVGMVDVETLDDELLFVMPEDREAIGQNGTTPDGRWLVYIDAPRGSSRREPCQGARVAAYNFDTKEQRVLTSIDVAIHHVTAYDNRHVVFCHPPGRSGLMMTDLDGGQYVELREGDPGVRGHLCHFLMTRRGIAYEVPGLSYSGLYEPLTRRRFEFKLPPGLGYVHTGWDPEGRLWFYECRGDIHQMIALTGLDDEQGGQWLQLSGNWPTYGGGQKAHFHAQLTPDRKWILFTGGDPATETNHVFLLDVSDLKEVAEITSKVLSPAGEYDMTQRRLPEDLLSRALPIKSVASSGFKPGFGPENTIDRDLATLWGADGDGQWIRYDLGEVASVRRVFIAWYAGDRRKERFDIAVSNDAEQWRVVFSGASSGTASGPEPCDLRPFSARYVRITGHGNTSNSWNSMEEVFILRE